MRCVAQRVSRARVLVEGAEVGAIETGLVALVALLEGDQPEDLTWMEKKLVSLRVFPDEAGKMNRSVLDVKGSVLLVSQFTLSADVGKGARPSFMASMQPSLARALFDEFADALRRRLPVATGRFGADMQVELTNNGPVTLWLDSRSRGK